MHMFFLLCLTGMISMNIPVQAAVLASAPFVVQHLAMPADRTQIDPAKPGVENPTEGGFVFYNRQFISSKFGKSRQVLLTFDDGPNPNTTPIVLDVLKKRNLKAIFFLVGSNVRKYPDLVRRIHAEGHTLGNHTYYHLNLPHYAADRITQEIRSTNDLIKQITGVKPTVFRPPYGALNQTVLDIMRREGLDVMLWSVDPGDWRNRNMNRTVDNLKHQLHLNTGGCGGIVLLHDTLPSTAHALEPFLVALTQQGLLPTPFGEKPGVGRDRSFWAAKLPAAMRWGGEEAELYIIPDSIHRPLLQASLNPNAKTDISPLTMIRARKTGQLLKIMVTRVF